MVSSTVDNNVDAPSLLGDISHKRINAFGKKLSVIRLDGEEFLIGVQIASLLKRETFNMYRSMKIKNILIQRANPEQVDFLCKCNAVRTGTHSVTLIPYEAGLYFIADALTRQKKTESFPFAASPEKTKNSPKSFIVHQPKLHRRKAHPWDVHRSIKREELLLSGKNSAFADLNTPFNDIKAKQIAMAKLNSELNNSLSDKSSKKMTKPKSFNPFGDPFNSLLFAADSLEESFGNNNNFETVSAPSSPSNTSTPSTPTHLSNSAPTSPVASPFYSPFSPQNSPPSSSQNTGNGSTSNQESLLQFLPQFNLGIFSNSSNSSSSNSPFSSNSISSSQFPVSSF